VGAGRCAADGGVDGGVNGGEAEGERGAEERRGGWGNFHTSNVEDTVQYSQAYL
jgi:hypothetical protein